MTNASPHLQEGMVIIHLLGEVSASLNWVCTAQGEHRFVLNFSWIRFSNLIGSKLWAMLLQPKEFFFFPPLFSNHKSWASKMRWANCQLHLQMCTTMSGSKWFVSSAGMHFRFNLLLDIYLLIIQSTSEMIWLIFSFLLKISAVLLLNANCSAFSRNRLSVPTNAFWGDKLDNLLICEFSVHLLLEYLPACQSVWPKALSRIARFWQLTNVWIFTFSNNS